MFFALRNFGDNDCANPGSQRRNVRSQLVSRTLDGRCSGPLRATSRDPEFNKNHEPPGSNPFALNCDLASWPIRKSIKAFDASADAEIRRNAATEQRHAAEFARAGGDLPDGARADSRPAPASEPPPKSSGTNRIHQFGLVHGTMWPAVKRRCSMGGEALACPLRCIDLDQDRRHRTTSTYVRLSLG